MYLKSGCRLKTAMLNGNENYLPGLKSSDFRMLSAERRMNALASSQVLLLGTHFTAEA